MLRLSQTVNGNGSTRAERQDAFIESDLDEIIYMINLLKSKLAKHGLHPTAHDQCVLVKLDPETGQSVYVVSFVTISSSPAPTRSGLPQSSSTSTRRLFDSSQAQTYGATSVWTSFTTAPTAQCS